MTPSCPYSIELAHLVGGGLSDGRARVVRKHTQLCLSCRRESNRLERLIEEISAPLDSGVSTGAVDAILTGLDLARSRPAWRRRAMAVASLAAAAALCLLAILIPGGAQPPTHPARHASRVVQHHHGHRPLAASMPPMAEMTLSSARCRSDWNTLLFGPTSEDEP